jgi:hypothetical protein
LTTSDNSKIKDIKNLDRYGILLMKTKWLETIQELSNQNGPFTKEWQFHYWFASCRKEVDGQTLDIAIPMCFYNYNQEVTGANIDFKLPDVTKAKDDSYQDALIKFEEFSKTDLFNIISNLFGNQWSLYGYSNIHTHPGSSPENCLSSFSSIDLDKSNTNPGVVFPLATGSEIPHFTGIQIHVEGKCELVHNEFRVFNRKDNIKLYEHGRCLTVCEGFEESYKEPVQKQETEIDEIFGQKRWQPPAPKKPKIRRDQFIINNLEPSDNLANFSKELLKLLKSSDFEPAYNIDAKNIRPKQTKTFGGYRPTRMHGNSLFENFDEQIYPTYKSKTIPYTQRSKDIREMINKLCTLDEYDHLTFMEMEDDEIEAEYELVREEAELQYALRSKPEDERTMIEYLLDNGMDLEEVINYDKNTLEKIAKQFVNAFESDSLKDYDNALIEAENFLIDNKIMSQPDIDVLDDAEILAAYARLKGEDT